MAARPEPAWVGALGESGVRGALHPAEAGEPLADRTPGAAAARRSRAALFVIRVPPPVELPPCASVAAAGYTRPSRKLS